MVKIFTAVELCAIRLLEMRTSAATANDETETVPGFSAVKDSWRLMFAGGLQVSYDISSKEIEFDVLAPAR